MRIPFFAFVYKVRPSGRVAELGWKGWRLYSKHVSINEPCICECAILDGGCECAGRGSHTHSGLGSDDRGIFMPEWT
jgi:hypothetical protein